MVQRTNHAGGNFYDTNIVSGLRLRSMTRTVIDGEQMDANWAPVLFIDIAAAGDLVLPTPSSEIAGLTYFITSLDDTHAIDLESPEDSVIQSVAAGESYILHCDGAEWRVIG